MFVVIRKDFSYTYYMGNVHSDVGEIFDKEPGQGRVMDKFFIGPNDRYLYIVGRRGSDKAINWRSWGASMQTAALDHLEKAVKEGSTVTYAALFGNGNYHFQIGRANPAQQGDTYGFACSTTDGTPADIAFSGDDRRKRAKLVVASPGKDNAVFILEEDGRWYLSGPPDLLANFHACLQDAQK